MTVHSKDQLKHDRVNLGRLVRRLDQVVKLQNWDAVDQLDAWATATSIHSTVEYAKELLEKIQRFEYDDSVICSMSANSSRSVEGEDTLQDLSDKLEHLEQLTEGIKESLRLQQRRSQLLLSKMKSPQHVSALPEKEAFHSQPEAELLPAETIISAVAIPLAQQPIASSKESAESASGPTTTTRQTATSSSLQTQEELSAQLAQMAAQLKRNALHFSDSLAKEKGVLEEAQVKLESNYGLMKIQRLRLRDFTGKSGGTTWMVLGAIACVIIAWVIMFMIIRLT
ncbi:hypothetical protein FRC03_009603 [Tulasnella sp. 419]|nr:hypothetical protein FRC03_009603 [Tulasnella sp. 419]